MLKIKTGDIDNTELKFVCTNETYLNRYLSSLDFVEELKLIQYFDGDIKYRKIIKEGECKFTSNYKHGNITTIKEIDEDTYLSHIADKEIIKIRKIFKDDKYSIEVDYFIKPIKFIMVEVSGESLENYRAPKGLVNVNNLDAYENKNIFNDSITKTNIVIEGGDGVGKSSTIEKLLEYGIICLDRSNDVISKNMMFDIDMQVRALEIEKYLLENDLYVLFLINNNKEELMRRIYSRGEVSAFDDQAYEYNLLYLNTYKYMLEHSMLHDKLDIVDCTNLNKEEQVNKVKERILHF